MNLLIFINYFNLFVYKYDKDVANRNINSLIFNFYIRQRGGNSLLLYHDSRKGNYLV